jgi:hypothetical protein
MVTKNPYSDFTFDTTPTQKETNMRPQYKTAVTAAKPVLNARDRKAMEASAYDHDAVTAIIQGVMDDTGTKMLTRREQQRVADIFGMVLG